MRSEGEKVDDFETEVDEGVVQLEETAETGGQKERKSVNDEKEFEQGDEDAGEDDEDDDDDEETITSDAKKSFELSVFVGGVDRCKSLKDFLRVDGAKKETRAEETGVDNAVVCVDSASPIRSEEDFFRLLEGVFRAICLKTEAVGEERDTEEKAGRGTEDEDEVHSEEEDEDDDGCGEKSIETTFFRTL